MEQDDPEGGLLPVCSPHHHYIHSLWQLSSEERRQLWRSHSAPLFLLSLRVGGTRSQPCTMHPQEIPSLFYGRKKAAPLRPLTTLSLWYCAPGTAVPLVQQLQQYGCGPALTTLVLRGLSNRLNAYAW